MILDGKVAIITGSASGVGRASAIRFAEEGASVVCADIDAEAVKETARLVESSGGAALPLQVDVSQDADVAGAVASAVDRFGRLDIMFNNVGIPTPRFGMTLADHSVEDFDRLMAVNVRGPFLGCKYAIAQFKEQGDGGVILNTGSVAGLVGWGGGVYGASKGAVHQLTRAIAIECAPDNIRANAICPGAMPLTGFAAAGGMVVPPELLPQVVEQAAASHPLGRPIDAEDCAEAAVFLCSHLARNITGILVPIDAGHTAR